MDILCRIIFLLNRKLKFIGTRDCIWTELSEEDKKAYEDDFEG